jgi:uncharacterized ion transporter superfamily protein YfcC
MKGEFRLNMEKYGNFLGTYFSKDTVLRLTVVAKILSWVVVGVYSLEWMVQALAMILQLARGFWTGMGFTDVAQSILYLFEQPLRGVVYFVVLQGMAQALQMFMDMEDNTRRAARNIEQK